MFCELIGSAGRKVEVSRKERPLKEAEILAGAALDHLHLGQAFVKARESNAFELAFTAASRQPPIDRGAL